jgi:hypothetical protein
MRFAVLATAAAAIAAAPLLGVASGPRMDSQEFLSAVRCVAYQNAAGAGRELGAARYLLNAEARRQPAETAAQARAEAAAIAQQAAGIENAAEAGVVHVTGASACMGASLEVAPDGRSDEAA